MKLFIFFLLFIFSPHTSWGQSRSDIDSLISIMLNTPPETNDGCNLNYIFAPSVGSTTFNSRNKAHYIKGISGASSNPSYGLIANPLNLPDEPYTIFGSSYYIDCIEENPETDQQDEEGNSITIQNINAEEIGNSLDEEGESELYEVDEENVADLDLNSEENKDTKDALDLLNQMSNIEHTEKK